MTAKKAVKMIREKIAAEVHSEKKDATYLHIMFQYEREQECRARIAALSRALCCVGEVEKELAK